MITSGSSRRLARSAAPNDCVWAWNLALGDLATGRLVNVLDRVFQRDDVVAAVRVHFLNHGGKRRRLAAADRTGDEHQTVVILGQDLQLLGQAEFVHRPHLGIDDAENGVVSLALANDVGAETGQPGHLVAEIDAVILFQRLKLHRVEKGADQRLGVGGCQDHAIMVEGLKRAVTAHQRRRADSHMDVGSARVEAEAQQLDDAEAVGEVGLLRHLDLGLAIIRIGRGSQFRLGTGLFQARVSLDRGGFHRGSLRLDGLAKALRLGGIDNRLL